MLTIEVREDGSVFTAPFKLPIQHAPTLVANMLDTAKKLNEQYATYAQGQMLKLSNELVERIKDA